LTSNHERGSSCGSNVPILAIVSFPQADSEQSNSRECKANRALHLTDTPLQQFLLETRSNETRCPKRKHLEPRRPTRAPMQSASSPCHDDSVTVSTAPANAA
jgi:hypothetical protein